MDSGTKIPIKNSIASKMLLVVLGLYLLIATTVTLSHGWMEYKYQKANIIQDLGDMEIAFENGLAVSLWGINQKALRATVEGMLMIPSLVGVTIKTDKGVTVAIGGIVSEYGETREVGLHVNLSGCGEVETTVHAGESYKFEMFERQFPIKYNLEGESILLGWATIYSNSSVIYRRMKLHIAMLAVNVVLTMLTFTVAMMWVVNRYLRKSLVVLTNAVVKIGKGDLDTKIKIVSNDEIGQLATSFNQMTKDLRTTTTSIEKLQQAEEELQKTVKELEQFNNLAVGRELVMIELKKEIDALLRELGREEEYKSDYEKIISEPLSGNGD